MKTGILIIAHAPLASALRASALHVFPDAGLSIRALDVQANTSVEQTLAAARELKDDLQTGTVLVLCDVLGATPCNVAHRVADGPTVRLLAGVNLPMLLRAVNYQDESLDDVVARAIAGGTQGIVQVVPESRNT